MLGDRFDHELVRACSRSTGAPARRSCTTGSRSASGSRCSATSSSRCATATRSTACSAAPSPPAWARKKAPLWYEELRTLTSTPHGHRHRGRRRARRPRRRAARARRPRPHPEHQRRSRRTPPTCDASADAVADAHARRRARGRARAARSTAAHPYVIGEWMHAPDAPTVLLYAHHDVQPPGYVDRWTSRPVRARASATAASTAAAPPTTRRARSRTSPRCGRGSTPPARCPCNVKVLVEGEEEIGSPGLAAVPRRRTPTSSRADVLVLADAGNWTVGTPGLTYSLRGLAGVDVRRARARRPGALRHGRRRGARSGAGAGAHARVARRRARRRRVRRLLGRLRAARRRRARPARRAARRTSTACARAWGVRDGVELAGDPTIVGVRAALAAPVGHRHRDRRPPDRGLVEPDRRARPRRASACASGAGQDPARLNDALRRAPRAARAARARAHRHRARRGRPRGTRDPTGWAFDAADARAARRLRRRPGAAWASAARSRSSARSPTRSAASPRCCSAPPTRGSRIHGEDESLHLGDWHKLIAQRGRCSSPNSPRDFARARR